MILSSSDMIIKVLTNNNSHSNSIHNACNNYSCNPHFNFPPLILLDCITFYLNVSIVVTIFQWKSRASSANLIFAAFTND